VIPIANMNLPGGKTRRDDGKTRRVLFGGLYYTFFANGFTALVISAVLPHVIETYGLSYEMAGTILSLIAVGNLVATYLSGFLADRFGLKATIVVLSTFVGVGYLGLLLTSSKLLLCVFAVMIGLTRGAISNVNNYVINNESSGKPKYLNYLHTFYAVGAFLSPLFISLLMTVLDSWKAAVAGSLAIAFSIVGVYSVLPIGNKRTVGRQEEQAHASCQGQDPRHAPVMSRGGNTDSGGMIENGDGDPASGRRTRTKLGVVFYLSCVVLFFYVGAENAINGWLVTYLTSENLVSTAFAQALLSGVWLIMIAGRLICAALSERVPKTLIVFVCSLGATATFSVFLISSSPLIITISLVGVGFFLSPLYPTIISVCGDALSGRAGLMGTFLSVGGLGKIVVPYVVGAAADRWSMTWGMWTILISLVLVVVFALLVSRSRVKQPSIPTVLSSDK